MYGKLKKIKWKFDFDWFNEWWWWWWRWLEGGMVWSKYVDYDGNNDELLFSVHLILLYFFCAFLHLVWILNFLYVNKSVFNRNEMKKKRFCFEMSEWKWKKKNQENPRVLKDGFYVYVKRKKVFN